MTLAKKREALIVDMTKEQVWRFYETLARIISRREGVDVKLVSLKLKEDAPKEQTTNIEIKNNEKRINA